MNLKPLALLLAGGLLAGSTLMANPTQWQLQHPRRTEVNARLENQNDRIQQGVKSGELSRHEAKKLHQEDRHIRQEERNMAAKHGGHLTTQEQRKLNRQENKVSNQLYYERHEQ